MSSFMKRGLGEAAHRDFLLVERDQDAPGGSSGALREVLRSAWPLPADTLITSDLPVLLTILSMSSERTAGIATAGLPGAGAPT